MAADSSGNDLSAVGVPLTGLAAIAPVDAANVIADADMGKTPLALVEAYVKLGLYKQDGGPQEARDDEDAIEFFQQGYKIAGDGTLTIQINLAEDNEAVNKLIDGKEPNEQGVVYVDSNLPDALWILFVATRFKNGTELRRNGVARVQAVEVDQEERGSVRGKSVTLEWVPDDLFNGSPYKKWLGKPAVTPAP